MFQLVVETQGRLRGENEFGAIIIKREGERLVRLRDVARMELGAKAYDVASTLDGRASLGMAIYQLPGANAFATAQRIRATMAELKSRFPPGMEYSIVFDPTQFVEASVEAVVHTLIEAILLVFVVVMVFLQNWRTALIPMLAVPVALVGTFAGMAALGYSINNLTLFGLVLAIGIVVDDAIVVVEAVEFHLARGLSARDATYKAMQEVSGAVIGVSLVLCAVFVPAAFIPGLTGQFFRQFAVTIAISTAISAFNSLTLSPALCPLLLGGWGHGEGHGKAEALPRLGIALAAGLAAWIYREHLIGGFGGRLPAWAPGLLLAAAGLALGYFLAPLVNAALGAFFAGFNRGFEAMTKGYGWITGRLLRGSLIVLLVYGGLLYLTGEAFRRTPSGFIPPQDQGYLVVNVQLPEGASIERTEKVVRAVSKLALEVPGIAHFTGLAGFSILSQANMSNAGGGYVSLKPFAERRGRHADAIMAELNAKLAAIEEGAAAAFGAPPILGLGSAGGFKMQV
ncbi:MAG TPA: efflux RND transporter permease subunit, partial [Planctomycetia bacterium]|nr:efflux RND transporter permease subunit [Planctomycetia bacterium]